MSLGWWIDGCKWFCIMLLVVIYFYVVVRYDECYVYVMVFVDVLGVVINDDWDVFGMCVFGSNFVIFEGVELLEFGVCGGFEVGDFFFYMECNLVVGFFYVLVLLGIVEVVDVIVCWWVIDDVCVCM